MVKTPSPRTRKPKTKVEVKQELEAIRDEVAEEQQAAAPKAGEVTRLRETEVREAVKEITVDGVVQEIAGLGLEISKALNGINEKLTQEVNLLATVREAVALERQELDRLHKIDTVATAIDQLLADWEQQKEKLEADIAARTAAWVEQGRQREREQKESEEILAKQRRRELEEYEYKKAIERKKTQDAYEEELRQREKQNQERQEELERSWAQREAAIGGREDELARLTGEVNEFPARLEREVAAAVKEATAKAEARFEQQLALLRKDAEADTRVAGLQINSLEQVVARQAAQIEALQSELNEAKKQVQDIAVRAIEGASGAKALAHINQIAMEQAKQRSSQG
jgi:colicin import membrane protein